MFSLFPLIVSGNGSLNRRWRLERTVHILICEVNVERLRRIVVINHVNSLSRVLVRRVRGYVCAIRAEATILCTCFQRPGRLRLCKVGAAARVVAVTRGVGGAKLVAKHLCEVVSSAWKYPSQRSKPLKGGVWFLVRNPPCHLPNAPVLLRSSAGRARVALSLRDARPGTRGCSGRACSASLTCTQPF